MTLTDIRIRELVTSVESYRILLAQKQKELEQVRVQIIRIGQELCDAAFADLLQLSEKNPVAVETLATFIINMVKSQSTATVNSGLMPDISAQLDDLRTQLDAQTRRAAKAEEQALIFQRQAEAHQVTLEDERRKNQQLAAQIPQDAPIEDTDQYESLFETWRQSTSFSQSNTAVKRIGEDGFFRKPELELEIEALLKVSRREAYRIIQSCEEFGLIKSSRGASTLGRPADIISLSSFGIWVYTRLTNKNPKSTLYEEMLKAHKSEAHIGLILSAAQLFQKIGFEVNREPAQVKIDENRTYLPDLIIAREGMTFYLEAETGERADRTSLSAKWENASIAGGGQIRVVTPRQGVMNTISGSITAWATDNGRKVTIYLTHLEELRKVVPGGNPWVRIREKGRA